MHNLESVRRYFSTIFICALLIFIQSCLLTESSNSTGNSSQFNTDTTSSPSDEISNSIGDTDLEDQIKPTDLPVTIAKLEKRTPKATLLAIKTVSNAENETSAVLIEGKAGAAEPGALIELTNSLTGDVISSVAANADGSFSIQLDQSQTTEPVEIAYAEARKADPEHAPAVTLTVLAKDRYDVRITQKPGATFHSVVVKNNHVLYNYLKENGEKEIHVQDIDGGYATVFSKLDYFLEDMHYIKNKNPTELELDQFLVALNENLDVVRLQQNGNEEIISDFLNGNYSPALEQDVTYKKRDLLVHSSGKYALSYGMINHRLITPLTLIPTAVKKVEEQDDANLFIRGRPATQRFMAWKSPYELISIIHLRGSKTETSPDDENFEDNGALEEDGLGENENENVDTVFDDGQEHSEEHIDKIKEEFNETLQRKQKRKIRMARKRHFANEDEKEKKLYEEEFANAESDLEERTVLTTRENDKTRRGDRKKRKSEKENQPDDLSYLAEIINLRELIGTEISEILKRIKDFNRVTAIQNQFLFKSDFPIFDPTPSHNDERLSEDKKNPFFVFTCVVKGIKQICRSGYDESYEIITSSPGNKASPTLSANNQLMAYVYQNPQTDLTDIILHHLPTGHELNLTSPDMTHLIKAKYQLENRKYHLQPHFSQNKPYVLFYLSGPDKQNMHGHIVNLRYHPAVSEFIDQNFPDKETMEEIEEK